MVSRFGHPDNEIILLQRSGQNCQTAPKYQQFTEVSRRNSFDWLTSPTKAEATSFPLIA
jgi:hypothetical protein